jgi:hypothetical protein
MSSQRDAKQGLVKIGDLLTDFVQLVESPPEKTVSASKRLQKRLDGVERIRLERQEEKQRLGYLARPFILCGLPFKPKKGQSVYKRVNGNEVLEIIASPDYGLPFGADTQVLVWVSTLAVLQMKDNGGKIPRVITFKSGADFLKGGVSPNPRKFRHPISSPAMIASRSMICPSPWNL